MRLELNDKNIKELRNLDSLRGSIEGVGSSIQAKANGMFGSASYGMSVRKTRSGWHSYVYTADRYAMRSNAVHNTLQKAVR